MEWFQVIVLALLQGITEFLPVSSSAHLILIPYLFSWADQGIAFDVAVHAGTLLAVVVYFRGQLIGMVRALLSSEGGEGDRRLTLNIIIATLPVIIVGGTLHDEIVHYLRSPSVIAVATVVFGLALLLANYPRDKAVNEYQVSLRVVILIGLAQVLALIPGTSRSGITMTAAIVAGMSQAAAARFSFLMAIPVIAGSAVYEMVGLLQQEAVPYSELMVGVGIAAVSAYVCIHYFLKLVERIGFTPFVVYRLLLGVVLFVVFV